MARPDKVLAMFRGVTAAALTGQFGVTATPDLICVKMDGNGQLVAATAGDAVGVVWTPEGKASTSVANYNVMPSGAKCTVFVMAEFTDDLGALVAGDTIYSSGVAGGVATTAPAGNVQEVGRVYANDQGDTRMFINLSGGVPASADLEQTVISGGAAGDHTVTGIATADDLVSVLRFGKSVLVPAAISGGAAGAHTVTGIATADTLVAVLRARKTKPVQTVINGGSAGAHTVTGIATADTLISVIYVAAAAASMSDLTSEFSISAADTIDNTAGTDTTSGFLIVLYLDSTSDEMEDLTSEFTISAVDTIDNTAGTDTSGDELLVIYRDATSDETEDLTSEFSVTAANTINNAAGTDTSGSELLVTHLVA